MVSHCMIIEFIILIPVITNFLTFFPNNKNVSVLRAFFFRPPGLKKETPVLIQWYVKFDFAQFTKHKIYFNSVIW